MPFPETTLSPPPREPPPLLMMSFILTSEPPLINKEVHRRLERLEGSSAISTANFLQECLDAPGLLSAEPERRKRVVRLLGSLCGLWGEFPTSYTYQGEVELLDGRPYAGSRNADVFQGRSGRELVAVKSLRVYQSGDPKRVKKRFARETVIWRQLRHPNILPLLGIAPVPGLGEFPCLISPWMPNGVIPQFVAGKPFSIRFKLLVDVCTGLEYLHAQDIVHGDLKGSNVLVDGECRARLADFGHANFDRSRWTDVTSNSSDPGGTSAYMAPELFSRVPVEGRLRAPLMRKEADIYALGTLIWEVSTGEIPFRGAPSCSIPARTSRGERPFRPPSVPILLGVWDMSEQCWDDEPARRPALKDIAATCKAYELLTESVAFTPPPVQYYSGSSGYELSSSSRDTQLLPSTSPLLSYPIQSQPGYFIARFSALYHSIERPQFDGGRRVTNHWKTLGSTTDGVSWNILMAGKQMESRRKQLDKFEAGVKAIAEAIAEAKAAGPSAQRFFHSS